jgi:hypothetical protein
MLWGERFLLTGILAIVIVFSGFYVLCTYAVVLEKSVLKGRKGKRNKKHSHTVQDDSINIYSN